MAITKVKEKEGRKGELKVNNGHATREFWVMSDIRKESIDTVLTASHGGNTIPARGDAYNDGVYSDSGLTVDSVDAEQQDGGYLWLVTVEYSTADNASSEDPLLETVKYRWSRRGDQIPVAVDRDDAAMANSAGEIIRGILMRERLFRVTVTRNEALASINVGTLRTFFDSVNTSSITLMGQTIAAESALMVDISIDGPNVRNDVEFAQVVYTIDIGEDHKLRAVDEGRNELIGGKLTAIQIDGDVATDPQLLDGSGRLLTSGDPVILEFDYFEDKNWSGFAFA